MRRIEVVVDSFLLVVVVDVAFSCSKQTECVVSGSVVACAEVV